ncbi:MAG: YfhO family protein, partial [Lachnospiraceae bacterium]|nr:YfhO family protein [Lachnospiraceae bacterium]
MNSFGKKDSIKNTLFVLAAITLAFVIYHLPHFIYGVSFIYGGDDMVQYYMTVVKCRRYLIEFFTTLISEHRFDPVLWDMSLGLGEDTWVSLHYYGISCPLMLLSLLFEEKDCAKAFSLLFFICIIVAALGVNALGKHRGWNVYQAVSASLIYCFTTYNVIVAREDICFMYPVAIFPFMVLGIDLIYENRKPWVYILSTFILGCLNFYFFYEAGILIAMYAVYRFFADKEKSLKERRKNLFFTFPVSSIIAIAMSAFVLLPVLRSGMSSNRALTLANLNLFYTREFYLEYFISILGFKRIGLWNGFFGFTIIGVISVILMFLRRNENNKGKKIIFLVLLAFSILPLPGLILSVFTYPTNRWIWAFCLIIAIITAESFYVIFELEKRERLIIMGAVIAFCILCILTPLTWAKKNYFLVTGSVIIAVISVFGFIKVNKKYRYVAGLTCIFAAVALNFYCEFYTSGFSKIKSRYFTFDECYEKMKDEEVTALFTDEGEPYRYDYAGHSVYRNTPAFNNQYGINGYLSLANTSTVNTFSEFGNYMQMSFDYNDLDSRI